MKFDDAYANGAYIDGADAYPDRWEEAALAFREKLGARAQLGVSYGPSARQTFDFFQPSGVGRGTMVFVHGGYWKAFDKSSWSHLAAGALARGWAVAIPSYDLCPDVRIADITRQIAAAVSKIADRTFGPMALAGHSAGGHLVCRMTDPLILPSEIRGRIKQIVSISPVADLEPLMQTTMNEDLYIDAAEAIAESPVNMQPPHGLDLTIWVGADERPAFLEQSEKLARSWGAKRVAEEGKHHFDVIDSLADPDSPMTKALLGLK
ncbi:alpha/beta hydrolase [Sulfitobacter donghicola]|uniref:Esterase n=1 Tax=Sulfitobacter donghicola DSW-25 = KCTC 12864 = JCM 14565 TaxID=1300350 RepID=A0A073IKE9_9RHOB|nr:alpha/beta hydrolase [Sulfitobacter donghicola]KEJ90813.1 esterase [Sulfitobacter donghicola DSW-25 = KCTC 12864 = JCM 14565]KIN68087.1 Esterase/lipase [Sulfitobacter donghicola DSW-25 = KCTC 12864 = JCM 14565]